MERETQWQEILRDLEDGKPVTNFSAFTEHNITRLGDVIRQLRKKGYDIETCMQYKYTPTGLKEKRWAVYKLNKEGNE